MSIESECLLAATGFISPEVTAAIAERAAGMPETIAKRVHAWLTGGRGHAWVPTHTRDAEKLRDKLGIEMTEIPGADVLPELLAAELLLEVNEARRTVLDRWPALHLTGGLDGAEPPLAFDRQQDWLSLVAAIEDPMRALTDLELGALLPDAVELFRENYPDLSDLITESMFKAIVEMSAGKRELAPGKDYSARLWLDLKEAVPLIEVAQNKPDGPKPGGASKTAEGLKTEAQKVGM